MNFQYLPFNIDPIAFSIGSLQIRWYSLSYFFAILSVYFLLRYRLEKKEFVFEIKKEVQDDFIVNLLLCLVVGMLIGGRVGYILLYDFENIKNIFSIENSSGSFVGIFGMSYYGALAGIIVGGMIFSKIKKNSFLKLADLIIPTVGIGYFFGRVGNFLNGELFGKPTTLWWGMYFPSDQKMLPRHPSQLYEALFEGLLLFVVFWYCRNKKFLKEKLIFYYVILYSIIRFCLEFLRENDQYYDYGFMFISKGQQLALIACVLAIVGLFYQLRKKVI